MKIRNILTVLGVVLACSWGGTAIAKAGKVLFVFGDAGIEKNGIKTKLRRGQSIDSGDQLYTGPKGRLHVRMTDSTMISLRPGTQFEVEDYQYGKSKEPSASAINTDTVEDRSVYRLLRGGFRTITGLIGSANKSAYKVKTPVATIGIRGTLFSARYCSGGDCGGRGRNRGRSAPRNGLYVGCGNGAVNLQTNKGELDIGNDEYGFVGGSDEEPELLLEPPEVLEQGSSDDATDSEDLEEVADGPTDEGETELNSDSEEIADRRGEVNEINDGGPDDVALNEGNPDEVLEIEADEPDGTSPEQSLAENNGNAPIQDNNAVRRDVAFANGPNNSGAPAFSGVERSDPSTIQTDGFGRLTQFVNDSDLNSGDLATYDIGTAANLPEGQDPSNPPIGFDSSTGINWGRWGAGNNGETATITEADGSSEDLLLASQSLHWVAGPESVGAPAIPQTGSVTYSLVGNTDPTDSFGNVGILGSATLDANFTDNLVTSTLQIGIPSTGQNWSASGSGDIGVGGLEAHQFDGIYSVNVSGSVSATGDGVFSGFMTEGAQGAGLGYSLSADLSPSQGVSEVNTVSGVAVFADPVD